MMNMNPASTRLHYMTMNDNQTLHTSDTYVRILMFSLILAFYSRIVTAVGVPGVFNFVHYAFFAIIATFVLLNIQTKAAYPIYMMLFLLSGSIALSAVNSGAGAINFVLEFVMLSQPFVLLYIMVNREWSEHHISSLRQFFFVFALINAAFAFVEYFALGLRKDDVKGVFLNMGAGHHVAGAIALSSIIYALTHIKSIKLKAGFILVQLLVTAFVDNKQTLVVFMISLALLTVFNFYSVKRMMIYLLTLSGLVGIVWVMMETVFPQLADWADYDKSFQGLLAKLQVFDIIHSYHQSFKDGLFGLGPGHTVGRLAQIMPDYYGFLSQLGATIHPATSYIWEVQQADWITNSQTGSSMWSLLFSWMGVYGDLGLLGLIIYITMWFFVYRKLCFNNYSKFLVITIVIHGAVFQWMEEPAYMLFVVGLIGLMYLEQMKKKNAANEQPGISP
ncbi:MULTISPECIES: hypothetical protein [Cohnella]|uniref:hypothetical protein n=1 Tax=Cohnella TaxID=329857 RepID=UPI0009B96F87|nr:MULTISPECIES: hypothetical protein [Cohnella]MBN2980267.1 hypothetical protein [Cohnella algarum]